MSKTKILGEEIVLRKHPINLCEEDQELFSHEFSKNIPSIFMQEVLGAVMTPEGVFLRWGKVSESLTKYSKVKYPNFSLSKDYLRFIKKNYWDRRRINVNKKALWITDRVSHNYFHWLFDVLPRLWLFHSTIANAQDYTLLLPKAYEKLSFVKHSLNAFDISETTYLSDEATYGINSLLIIEHTAPTGNYRPNIIQEVRQKLLAKLGNQGHFQQERIYISRSKASRRKILNEEALIKVLDAYQFSTVHFEDLSFQEQISITRRAKYLVSNHGAGLSNMLFMQPGSCIFELRQEDDSRNNCYFSLASANDLNYYYQNCPPDKSKVVNSHSDVYVDISKFKNSLNRMLTDS